MGLTLKMPQVFPKKKRKSKPSQASDAFQSQRSHWLSLGFLTIFSIVAIRAVTIHIFSPSADILENLARRQYQSKIDLSPYRGNIYDRRGEPLAISIRRPSLYVNPRVFDPSHTDIRHLSQILAIPAPKIRQIADRKNYFAWLARKLEVAQAKKVEALGIKGLYEISEPARFYPGGSDLSHLVGYVGLDNHGLHGIELGYDNFLQGDALKAHQERDARGESIYRDSLLALPEKTGKNIVVTLDSAVQNIAQQALLKGVQKANAKAGFAIVSDPHTGRILAIANAPSDAFDALGRIKPENLRNRALTDMFEPGSVVKPIVLSRALQEGVTTLDEVHNTYNGTYREDNWQIRDSHGSESMTTEEILIESSNIGTYRIMKRLGPEKLYGILKDFGFTSRDHQIGFPGQTFGRLSPWASWKPIRFANVAFGQGLYATGLELVQAFGAIANGGNLMKPYLIDHIESPEGGMLENHASEIVRRVLSPATAQVMRSVLRKVVEEGTGKNALLTHYSSAGKTGTSEKVDPATRAYADHLRIASFIGFAPAVDPHLVIYVVIDEPGNKPYYGGTWAAPVFKEIAEESLRYLNVAPDKIAAKDVLAKSRSDNLQHSTD